MPSSVDGIDNDGEESEDSVLNWQSVTAKRKKVAKFSNVQKKQRNDDVPSTSNNNQFADLAVDDDDDENYAEVVVKPQPIFCLNVSDVTKMINSLSKVVSKTEFNYKSLNDGQIKLNFKTIDSYRKVVKFLETNNFSYHTYQIKAERAFRFVIKGLHHTTPTETIKAELLLKGHQVRYIANVKSRYTKEPLPMFYVDLDPSPDNKKVYEIRYIDRCVVQIEAPKTYSDIVQCHRCQQYGHTKSYCRRPFVCVKCGLGHPTVNCPNNKDTLPRCIHCLQTHTANYKGCAVYKKLVQKRSPGPSSHQNPQFFMNNNEFPAINENYINNNANKINHFGNTKTYANVSNRNYEENFSSNVMKNIENLLNKQIELTTTLLNMMSLLMKKLCN